MWLPHSSLGFQCPVGRRMRCTALLRQTPQATIARSTIVACLFTCDVFVFYICLSEDCGCTSGTRHTVPLSPRWEILCQPCH